MYVNICAVYVYSSCRYRTIGLLETIWLLILAFCKHHLLFWLWNLIYLFTLNLNCFWQDKTFGLKNKKGAKQQKFIKAVTQQVKYGQQNPRQVRIIIFLSEVWIPKLVLQKSACVLLYLQLAAAEAEKNKKKDDKKKELNELNELFKPVVGAQKVSKGNWSIKWRTTLVETFLWILHLKGILHPKMNFDRLRNTILLKTKRLVTVP